MSKAMTAATKEQLIELMQYLSQNISVPTIGIGGGFAPIGCINFFDAVTAPQGWLVCDGTTYNIADYPQLAQWYATQHGSANYYGGDGVTTFQVPDLRGEFLRGSGTNSHTNQGNGANVGVHQDGTLMPESLADDNMLAISKFTTTNFDFKVTPTTTGTRSKSSSITSDDWGRQITTRPTNTSYLICVKATEKDRTRNNITNRLSYLSTAVSEQNLEKYGYNIGDYFVGASGYYYYLADMDTFYGGYNNNAVINTHHIGIVVDTKANSKWLATGTVTGYESSDLHKYLKGTALDNIKSDFITLFGGSTGLEHLLGHKKMFSTNTSGAWGWSTNNEYISALTEVQLCGCVLWSMNKYQQGEAGLQLELFRKYRWNEIYGNTWIWLRSLAASAYACNALADGFVADASVTSQARATGLILFH